MRADSYKIAVIGGDRRQVYLAEILAERGCDVSACGLCGSTQRERIRETAALKEALEGADAVAAPVPFLRDGKIAVILSISLYTFSSRNLSSYLP